MSRDDRAVVGERIAAVLAALDTTPPREMAALDISRSVGLASRAVDSALRRMVELGWVDCGWDGSARERGFARRHAYKLTDEGVRRARQSSPAQRVARQASVVVHNERKGAHHG